jgi:XapX domain-containing protein
MQYSERSELIVPVNEYWRNRVKIAIGFLLAFLIGAGCRFFGIPSPAPNAILGALLVVAMTLGYLCVGALLK